MKEGLKIVGFVCFWVLIGLIMIALVSCARPSRLKMDYGTSAKLVVLNQTLNPEASKNLEPVTGMDGEAAEGVMERYRKGFEKTEAPPSYIFNIGR